jgi:acyl-CoA thioesterase-2
VLLDLAKLVTVTSDGNGGYVASCFAGRGGRSYGGQIVAQSLNAAIASGPQDAAPHSLHAHFLAPGWAGELVRYSTTWLKRGRSFSVIRVEAVQGDRVITTATVSFHVEEHSSEHQEPMPEVPAASACAELRLATLGGPSAPFAPIESRRVETARGHPPGSGASDPVPTLMLWHRCRYLPSDDPALHACGIVWMSDLTMTRTLDLPHTGEPGRRVAASLDHAVWFHRRARADDWLLSEQRSPIYTGSRGLTTARYFSREGDLVATSTQECLTRRVT